ATMSFHCGSARAEAGASGGRALIADGPNSTGNSPHSFAQYSIRFASAGTYYLYYRWRADETRTGGDVFTANSSWFGTTWGAHSTPGDQGPFYTSSANATQAPANNAWEWRPEGDTRPYEVSAAQLGAPLVFTVGTREAGMIFDRIVFATEPALTPAQLDALPNSGSAPPAPELGSAVGSAALTQVTVNFTRPLNPATVNAGRFNASGGLNVTGATVDTADARIVRLTTSAQTEGTAYTLTVNGVADTSGTAIAPDSTITFTAWRRVNGWVTKEIFFGITGATIDDLRNAPNFIEDRPDRVDYVRAFSLDRDPQTDNYGARLTAFLQPASAGSYDFFVANDDEAELLLSTDATAANLVSYGLFPLSPREFDSSPAFSSAPLAAGQRYLLQGLLKQGGGDVYLRVGARSSSGTGVPEVLTGDLISTWVNPDLGKVNFLQQPAGVNAAAGERARFEVRVEGTGQPLYYQWQRDGVDIPGAIRRVYTTPVLSAADNGRVFRCRVSAAGTGTLSGEAALAVVGSNPSPQQPYIGVNFVGGGNSIPGPLLPQDVAGAVPQENWNNLNGFTFDAAPLNDAAGAATPVTLSAFNLTETWYSGTLSTGDGNGWLLQGLVTAGSSTEPVNLVFSGVPPGSYQVLVYGLGFNFSPAYEQDWSITAGSVHLPITGRAEIGLDWTGNPAFRRITSTDPNARQTGNYVRFDNVSPAPDGSIMVDVTWVGEGGNTHQPAINAVQLVRVVEVATPPTLGAPAIQGGNLVLTWTGGNPPFAVERRDTVTGTPAVVTTTNERTATVPLTGAAGYIQVRGGN
ncbi:MAG TPA: Ig-like domain-containing protein, partial [Verrucomicrobiota bacterium]|nr:Ig-like domain-containing protein [Verrucomicrobiota bacterium]